MKAYYVRRLAALAALAIGISVGAPALAQDGFGPKIGGEAAKGTKAPLPSAEDQNKTLKLVRDVFKTQYEEAKTPDQKEALARDLMRSGLESEVPTERFVLLRVARDMAALAGEANLACRVIDEIGRWYQVDAAAMKREAVAKADQGATLPEHFKGVAEQAAALAEAAMLADDYDTASRMIEMARTAAKKARDAGLLQRVTERAKEVAELVKAKQGIQDALATLEKNPGDPNANLAAGSFYCFYRDDWAKGLAMLALGADGVYDVLGKKELVGAETAEEQAALGDGWYDLVAKHQGMARARIRAHAAGWYEKALTQLTGLAQIRVKKRLEEIEVAESGPEEKPDAPAPKTAAARKKPSFAGKWLDSFGSVIQFSVERRNVTGTYKNLRKSGEGETYTRYEGRITGTVSRDGRKLTAQWGRSSRWGPGGVRAGALAFQLAKDGKSFSGTYRQSDGSGAGAWSGTRMSDKTDSDFDPPSSFNNQDERRWRPGDGPPGSWRDRWPRGPRGR